MAPSIKDEILEIVATVIEKEAGDISLDAHLVQEVGADSMMALEILAALEKKYHIVVPEERLKEMTTVNKIIQMVETARKRG
ncbi:acyl carrier protein [Candidatus Velamenicoccus archaeovorus]|uniref:Acyl carrier protein n=1 Tax=Velamenicoccus archaeovorus TaxID=1930593 RepID=A0A410P3P8_VELA1|nr:acyl carrier protein [Candidatus Velamenicoccus archaeovorus]QAT16825.1 acyl carrier protein [Candidatus Velamenicoccus archaeovorus]